MTYKERREHSNKINQLIQEDKYSEARALILELLNVIPDDHWLLAQLSSTYYEEKQYDISLQYVEKALLLEPRCPLVQWHYAGALSMIGRYEDALNVYKRLIRRGVSRIAYGKCGEGLHWARSLINDCRYRAGLIYADMGDNATASRYIKSHIANRNRKTTSIYNLREVKRDLITIQQGKDTRSS